MYYGSFIKNHLLNLYDSIKLFKSVLYLKIFVSFMRPLSGSNVTKLKKIFFQKMLLILNKSFKFLKIKACDEY